MGSPTSPPPWTQDATALPRFIAVSGVNYTLGTNLADTPIVGNDSQEYGYARSIELTWDGVTNLTFYLADDPDNSNLVTIPAAAYPAGTIIRTDYGVRNVVTAPGVVILKF